MSGSLGRHNVNAALFKDRVCACMPILSIEVYSNSSSKLVYALPDSGSDETLKSRDLYPFLNLRGMPLRRNSYCGNW